MLPVLCFDMDILSFEVITFSDIPQRFYFPYFRAYSLSLKIYKIGLGPLE